MNLIKEIKCLGLEVPKEFNEMDEASLLMAMGGCGPGRFGDYFVPDTVYGMSIKPACGVHDLDYTLGKDKEKADLRFLENMNIIIGRSRFRLVRLLRQRRVLKYYLAVSKFGDSSFKGDQKDVRPCA